MKPLNIPQIEGLAAHIRDLIGDDDQTLIDTLEGETDAMEWLDRFVAEAQASKAMVAALDEQIKALTQRKRRIADREPRMKEAARSVMDAIGVRKIERPAATLYFTAGRTSVEITDPSDVPSQLCAVKTTPDKAAIKRALEAGETVPGAALVRGDDTLTMKVL